MYKAVPEVFFVFLPVKWKNYFAQLEVAQLSFFLTLFKFKKFFFSLEFLYLPSNKSSGYKGECVTICIFIHLCKKSLLAPTKCERAGEIAIQKKKLQNEYSRVHLEVSPSNGGARLQTSNCATLYLVNNCCYAVDMRRVPGNIILNKSQIPALMEFTFKMGKQANK